MVKTCKKYHCTVQILVVTLKLKHYLTLKIFIHWLILMLFIVDASVGVTIITKVYADIKNAWNGKL
jgi:cytochrome b561